MRQERLQIVIPEWLKIELKHAADAKKISMSEYIKDTLKKRHVKEFATIRYAQKSHCGK